MKQIALVFLLLFASTASAAVVHGTAYDWQTLRPLKNAVIEVNSTPGQQMVAADGNYSFFLPPGSYEIRATYSREGLTVLAAQENITITGEGSFVLDLIMFATLESPEAIFNETEIQTQEEVFPPEASLLSYAALAALAAGITAFAVRAYLRRARPARRAAQKAQKVKKKARREPLPEDAKRVLEIIRKAGRITQKELRKQLPHSEAKASLIIAELEHRGLIKKFKRGRGNILRAA